MYCHIPLNLQNSFVSSFSFFGMAECGELFLLLYLLVFVQNLGIVMCPFNFELSLKYITIATVYEKCARQLSEIKNLLAWIAIHTTVYL